MDFNEWRIVRMQFCDGTGNCLTKGMPVYISKWTNARSLENAGYLRKPENDSDFDKIKSAIRDLDKEEGESENDSSSDLRPKRKYSKKLNEGDNENQEVI
jgi:hypothetical protein